MAADRRHYYYHGTPAENLDRIRALGLQAKPLTWLATDVRYAARWAEMRSSYWEGGVLRHKPFVVLRVSLPAADVFADPNLPGERRSRTTATAVPPEGVQVLRGDPWSGRRAWSPVAPRRKRNSAVAQRFERREVWDVGRDEWGEETRSRRVEDVDAPAHVTAGHWSEPAVLEARAAAEALQRDHNTLLGAGNFGVAYLVRGRGGATDRLAKMPAAHNMHGQPWGRDAQRHNILHEAGVANELASLGYASVPRGVYTEWGGGTPAFVRELGEPLSSISPAEYGALEAELLSIERDRGWRIHDELQLYRRPDGGVFVADVGQWQAPVASAKPWSRLDSSLHHLLREVQQKYLPGLATRDPGPNPPSERYAYTLREPVPTLPLLADDASRVAEALADLREEGDARYAGKYGEHQRRDDAQVAEEYLDELASRDAFGVPTPDDVRAFAPMARELLDGSGAGSAAKKNGRRRPARRR